MHVTGDTLLCPRQALRHILKARRLLGGEETPYLCVDLEATEVAKVLQATASSIGVRGDAYSTHSIRIGGATALLNGKVDGL